MEQINSLRITIKKITKTKQTIVVDNSFDTKVYSVAMGESVCVLVAQC